MGWHDSHNHCRVPLDTDTDPISYVDQSKHERGSDSESCLTSFERTILETWDLNNPDNKVPTSLYWKGIHDDTINIEDYIIPEMKYVVE